METATQEKVNAVGDPRLIVFQSDVKVERIVAIEYQREGRCWCPNSVMTEEREYVGDRGWFKPDERSPISIGHGTYDFDWCKSSGGIYYHMSGSGFGAFYAGRFCKPKGLPARLWLADGFRARDYYHAADRKISKEITLTARGLRRRGYLLITEPLDISSFDWMDRKSQVNPFEVASESKVVWCSCCKSYVPTDSPCEHIEWCEACSWWVNVATHKNTDGDGECAHNEEQRWDGDV